MNIRSRYVSTAEFNRIPTSEVAAVNHKHKCRTGQWIFTDEEGICEVLEIEVPLKNWEKPGYNKHTRSPQLNKILGKKRRKFKLGKL